MATCVPFKKSLRVILRVIWCPFAYACVQRWPGAIIKGKPGYRQAAAEIAQTAGFSAASVMRPMYGRDCRVIAGESKLATTIRPSGTTTRLRRHLKSRPLERPLRKMSDEVDRKTAGIGYSGSSLLLDTSLEPQNHHVKPKNPHCSIFCCACFAAGCLQQFDT